MTSKWIWSFIGIYWQANLPSYNSIQFNSCIQHLLSLWFPIKTDPFLLDFSFSWSMKLITVPSSHSWWSNLVNLWASNLQQKERQNRINKNESMNKWLNMGLNNRIKSEIESETRSDSQWDNFTIWCLYVLNNIK